MCDSPILKTGIPGNGARNLLDGRAGNTSLLVTPSGRLGCSSSKFPLHEDCKVYRIRRIPSSTRRRQSKQWRRYKPKVVHLTWTCTQDTNNFAANEFTEVVNLSGLAVYKGSNRKGEIIVVRLKGNKSSK